MNWTRELELEHRSPIDSLITSDHTHFTFSWTETMEGTGGSLFGVHEELDIKEEDEVPLFDRCQILHQVEGKASEEKPSEGKEGNRRKHDFVDL